MWEYGFTVRAESDQADFDALRDRFVERLEKAGAGKVDVEGDTIHFTGGLFRFPKIVYTLLYVRHGQVQIDADGSRVSCRLCYEQVWTYTAVMILLLLAPRLGRLNYGIYLLVVLGFMIFGYLLNTLPSRAEFRSFMKRQTREAGFAIEETV